MSTQQQTSSAVVTTRDGVTIYTGQAPGIRNDAFVVDEKARVVAFKITLAKHPELKEGEKAVLHGRFDFGSVTLTELFVLASKFLAFRWVQIYARNAKTLRECEGQHWKVREFIDVARAPKRTASDVRAELLNDPGKLVASMTAEQIAALLAVLQRQAEPAKAA